MVRYVDATPTMTAMVPVMVAMIDSDNAKAREAAIEELYRMAGLIDGLAGSVEITIKADPASQAGEAP